MLDTEIVHFKTWAEFSKEYGVDYDVKKRLKYAGMIDEKVVEEFAKEMGSRDLAISMRKKYSMLAKNTFKTMKKVWQKLVYTIY